MSLPSLSKGPSWTPLRSEPRGRRGMQSWCPSPDELFRNVPNLSDTVYITGTRAFAYGGYSDIWRGICWDGDVTQDVAIKMIRVAPRVDVTTERLKTRISREVITWSKARHKNIIPFYGLYWRPDSTSNDLPAMVYPYCEAGTCTEYLKNHPDADRLDIMRQVADGLIYLHTLPKQVIHGDIKACNVLMKNDGTPMLADFGLSRIVAEISTGLTTSSSRGSYRWMAPELFGGVEDQIQVLVTAASDVWAFGCLCVEILTGMRPWASIKHDTQVMKAIAIDRRQPSLGSGYEPNVLSHILRHCWIFEANHRPSMMDVLRALNGLDASCLDRPHCVLTPVSGVLSESPPRILNNDRDSFTETLSGTPLFGSSSNSSKTPLARIPPPEPLFTQPLSLQTCPPPPTPSTDATGATPYMDSLGLTPSDSTSSEPSSGLASRDEPPLFDSMRPSLPNVLPGPERHPKISRKARMSNDFMWPRMPSSGSSTLPTPEPQEFIFSHDRWRNDSGTPSSTHTRCSSRTSSHHATPPRIESYNSHSPAPRPSPLTSRTTEGYASDRPTLSPLQYTPVTSNSHFSGSQSDTGSRRHNPTLNIPPPSPSPSSQSSSSHSLSPSRNSQSNYMYQTGLPSRAGAWSMSSTPRDHYFRPAQSTAIRITKPDGTPVTLPSPVKERRHP